MSWQSGVAHGNEDVCRERFDNLRAGTCGSVTMRRQQRPQFSDRQLAVRNARQRRNQDQRPRHERWIDPAGQANADCIPGAPRRDDDRGEPRCVRGGKEQRAVFHARHRQKFPVQRLQRCALAGDLHHVLVAADHFEPAGPGKIGGLGQQAIGEHQRLRQMPAFDLRHSGSRACERESRGR